MTRRRYTQCSWIAVVLILLGGCANSPPNKYYTLSIESPCPSISPAVHTASLELTAIHLPGVIDRPQLVVRTGPQTVEIREFDRWAEPLDQMATRILVEDIVPCQSLSASGKSRYFLSVSIDEFMADTSGHARLAGRWWALEKGEEKSVQTGHLFTLSEGVNGTDGAESAAAMSVLMSRLANEIVRWLSHPENLTPARPST